MPPRPPAPRRGRGSAQLLVELGDGPERLDLRLRLGSARRVAPRPRRPPAAHPRASRRAPPPHPPRGAAAAAASRACSASPCNRSRSSASRTARVSRANVCAARAAASDSSASRSFAPAAVSCSCSAAAARIGVRVDDQPLGLGDPLARLLEPLHQLGLAPGGRHGLDPLLDHAREALLLRLQPRRLGLGRPPLVRAHRLDALQLLREQPPASGQLAAAFSRELLQPLVAREVDELRQHLEAVLGTGADQRVAARLEQQHRVREGRVAERHELVAPAGEARLRGRVGNLRPGARVCVPDLGVGAWASRAGAASARRGSAAPRRRTRTPPRSRRRRG